MCLGKGLIDAIGHLHGIHSREKKKKFRLSYSADLSTSFKMYLFPVKFEKNPFEITPARIV